MDWKECCDKRIVKEISSDLNMIESLIMSSSKRLATAQRLEIDNVTASTVISLYYDCIRELLEVIASKNSFKIYNHECYTSFLKEVLKQYDLAVEFDRYRKIRNSINYYGKDIAVTDAKQIRKEMLSFIEKINELLK